MLLKFLCLLVILDGLKATEFRPGIHHRIDLNSHGGKKNSLIFCQQFAVPSRTANSLKLHGFDDENFSYAVFQVHSFRFNVTLSLGSNLTEASTRFGTNLGFVLSVDQASSTFFVLNDNIDEVQFMVAVAIYNKTAPQIDKQRPDLSYEETEDFVVLKLPSTDESVEIFSYFEYLDRFSFSSDAYFDGIRSLLFDDAFRNANQVKPSSTSSRYFEKVPGTGLVMASVIFNALGQPAFYIPAVAYSCPPNTWSSHCTDVNILKQSLSVCLVLLAVVMILNMMLNEVFEVFLNGLLMGSFLTYVCIKSGEHHISDLGTFMLTIFSGIVSGVILAIIALHFPIGRYLTKLNFSAIIMAFVMEVFFESVTSIYWQLGGTILVSFAFSILNFSFSVFLGGLLFIIGLSHLLKVGNIHRLLSCNVNALTFEPSPDESIWSFSRQNFVNSRVEFNALDIAFIIFYVVISIFVTIRKELYLRELQLQEICDFDDDIEEHNRGNARSRLKHCVIGIKAQQRLKLVSRCRRHHYRSNVIHERSPLISHWVNESEDDDEVFVSPNSNSRFMQTLSSNSRERIDAIQNFHR